MAMIYRWARGFQRQCQQCLATVTSNLQKNNLWKNVVKNTICTTINLIIGLIPAVVAAYGRSTYLGAMASVFGHPGRRFGQMTEVLILIILGVFVAIAWSTLGLYLSSLAYDTNVEAAWAIRAVFFTLALVLHGVLRSWAPRLFMFVFFFLLVTLTILTSAATSVSATMVTQIAYPILTATGIIILVNVTIFPEFSSGFLGRSTIETLGSTINCFQEAGDWFMSDSKGADGKDIDKEKILTDLRTKLVALTDKKSKLRTQLGNSKKAQAECNFELVFSVLPPRSLKPISVTLMSRLVQVTICLINACESKYALTGYEHEEDNLESQNPETSGSESDSDSDSGSQSSSDSDNEKSEHKAKKARRKSKHVRNIELVKPIREIESGDIDLLEHILLQVRGPAKILESQMQAAVHVITSALAYCYDVPKLPSGSPAPRGIVLEEIDVRVDIFAKALLQFDQDSAEALENAASMTYGQESKGDILPRMETHLISSFLISLRQAAAQVMDMLKFSRSLVERRQARNNRRRLYWPKISWKKWLTSGGERDVNSLPDNARKEARAGHGLREEPGSHDDDPSASDEQLLRHAQDEEAGHTISKQPTHPEKGKIPRRKGPPKSEASTMVWLRGLAADTVELFVESDDLSYALKMCVAAFIVTWPAFVPSWNDWYNSVRGSWASIQLILVFEVSVGTSLQGFFLRIFGVVFGCVVGFLAYEIRQGNHVVAVVILVIGIIPSSYIHLGTPYVKTGIISIVSMSVVALSTLLQQNLDQPWEIFVQRMVCFLIGGTVALLIEMFFFPVRARDRLVESLASSIQQISQMQASVAVGIDSPMKLNIKSQALSESFAHAKEKAEQALTAARTFLPFCLTEPRMKGSFKGQALIYGEIIYVLFQIIDRMDNMLHIRKAYGSSVLEELNTEVLPYRRNVASSITLSLFAVHEALTTRLPLPQFLPSSRVAQLRYISRVRELLLERATESARNSGVQTPVTVNGSSVALHAQILRSMTRQNFLSWNASSAGQMEIIEYLEELIDLSKLLVGVNAFRSGMLERPKFYEYIKNIKARESERASAITTTTSAATETEQQQAARTRRGSRASGRRRMSFSFKKVQSQGSGTGTSLGSAAGIGSGLRRRQTTDIRSVRNAAADRDFNEDTIADDLPMSLQRVMSKRMEERRLTRQTSDDPKGKHPLQPSRTWCP